MEFWNTHGNLIVSSLVTLLVLAGAIVQQINGPRAGKAKSWIDWLVALLRRVSPVGFKDEPVGASVPFLQGDSGKRYEGEVVKYDKKTGDPVAVQKK